MKIGMQEILDFWQVIMESFFDGGYAPNRWEKTKYGLRLRDYYKEAKNNIVAQKSAIKDLFLIVVIIGN